MTCQSCNDTKLAMCGRNCNYHNGRACGDVDRRGEHGCPPCPVCNERSENVALKVLLTDKQVIGVIKEALLEQKKLPSLLALDIGLPVEIVEGFFNGVPVSFEVAMQIATGLDISLDELIFSMGKKIGWWIHAFNF